MSWQNDIALSLGISQATVSRRLKRFPPEIAFGSKKLQRACKHGYSIRGRISKTFTSWKSMRNRCLREKTKEYRYYGGRGIAICERWGVFENFLKDMGERPAGMSIDRIDNNGNYEPGNCRWATPSEQANNTSKVRLITIGSKTLSMIAWSREVGLTSATIYKRIRVFGMTPEMAITTPRMWGGRREPKLLTEETK